MKQQEIKDNYNDALQQAIGPGFTALSTTIDVIKGIDLIGKNVIITETMQVSI
jgi:hypothetical protein